MNNNLYTMAMNEVFFLYLFYIFFCAKFLNKMKGKANYVCYFLLIYCVHTEHTTEKSFSLNLNSGIKRIVLLLCTQCFIRCNLKCFEFWWREEWVLNLQTKIVVLFLQINHLEDVFLY